METAIENLRQYDEVRQSQLDLLRANLGRQAAYPGYPQQSDRLVSQLMQLPINDSGSLVVPEGPWSTPGNYSNPRPVETEWFRQQGYGVDSDGRPLHPWFVDMMEDPDIGVVTGKGAYWHWGPNRTVDAIVLHDGHILLIRRHDTGTWALPGGFQDTETAMTGARREVHEETGIDLPIDLEGQSVYEGPVVDTRVTAHAWPVTSAFLFELDPLQSLQDPHGDDDADEARWFDIETAQHDVVFGSHNFLIQQALAMTVSH